MIKLERGIYGGIHINFNGKKAFVSNEQVCCCSGLRELISSIKYEMSKYDKIKRCNFGP